MKGSAARARRRQRAEALAEERAKRSSQQQIERLDEIFGKGKGAIRERARLTKLIAAEKVKNHKPKKAKSKKKSRER